jgi:hypothetical protein
VVAEGNGNPSDIRAYLIEVWRTECRRHGDNEQPWPDGQADAVAAALTDAFDDADTQVDALERAATVFLQSSAPEWARWRLEVLDRVLRAGGSPYGLSAIEHLLMAPPTAPATVQPAPTATAEAPRPAESAGTTAPMATAPMATTTQSVITGDPTSSRTQGPAAPVAPEPVATTPQTSSRTEGPAAPVAPEPVATTPQTSAPEPVAPAAQTSAPEPVATPEPHTAPDLSTPTAPAMPTVEAPTTRAQAAAAPGTSAEAPMATQEPAPAQPPAAPVLSESAARIEPAEPEVPQAEEWGAATVPGTTSLGSTEAAPELTEPMVSTGRATTPESRDLAQADVPQAEVRESMEASAAASGPVAPEPVAPEPVAAEPATAEPAGTEPARAAALTGDTMTAEPPAPAAPTAEPPTSEPVPGHAQADGGAATPHGTAAQSAPFWARVDQDPATQMGETPRTIGDLPEPPWPDELEAVSPATMGGTEVAAPEVTDTPTGATAAAPLGAAADSLAPPDRTMEPGAGTGEPEELEPPTRDGVGVSVADRATFESTVCSLVDDNTEFTVAFVGLDDVSGPSLGVPDDTDVDPSEEAASRALLWSLARRTADRGTCYTIGRGLVAVVLDRGRPKDVDRLVKRLPTSEVPAAFSWGAARFPDEATEVRELLRLALVRLATMREEKLTPRILVNRLRRAVGNRN